MREVGRCDARPARCVEGSSQTLAPEKASGRNGGVGDKVELPERDRRPLADYYRTCDVFVIPSRSAQLNETYWESEGFGRVYVDAALARKPVVGSHGDGAAVLHAKTGACWIDHSICPRSVCG